MTQRKRAIGFALMDTAFAADAKFVRLARRAETPTTFAAAVGVFWLILADCRRARERLVNWSDYIEYGAEIASLKDARLLVDDGFDGPTFDRWAPAYKSPWDAVRTGTQGYAEVPKGTQGDATSTHLPSTHISSTNGVGGMGEGELPGDDDSATAACRFLPDGGRWLGDREYVAAFEDMDHRYTSEWVLSEIQPAYAAILEKHGKVRAWDLKRMVELRLAERSRSEEREHARQVAESVKRDTERHRAEVEAATPEQREQAELQRQAIHIARKLGVMVPTDPSEVRKFVMKHGSAA